MHWNYVFGFFASEFNSLNFHQIIFTFIFQCYKILYEIFNAKKSTSPNSTCQSQPQNSMCEIHWILRPAGKCNPRGRCCTFSARCTHLKRRRAWSHSREETCTSLKRNVCIVIDHSDWGYSFCDTGRTLSGWSHVTKTVDVPLWWHNECAEPTVFRTEWHDTYMRMNN